MHTEALSTATTSINRKSYSAHQTTSQTIHGGALNDNAADSDEVNLVDITLEDITNSNISSEAVTLELSDGGRLTVMNYADVTFNLGDGTSWKADRQSKEWQQQA